MVLVRTLERFPLLSSYLEFVELESNWLSLPYTAQIPLNTSNSKSPYQLPHLYFKMATKHLQVSKQLALLLLPDELKNMIFLQCLREDISRGWHTGSPFYTAEGLQDPLTENSPNLPPAKRRKYSKKRYHKYSLLYVCKATNSLYIELLCLHIPVSFECDAPSLLHRFPSWPWMVPSEMPRKIRHCRLFVGLNADEETRKRSINGSDEIKEIPRKLKSLMEQCENLSKLEITLIDHLEEGLHCPGNNIPEDILNSMMWIEELGPPIHAAITLSKASSGEIVEVASYRRKQQ